MLPHSVDSLSLSPAKEAMRQAVIRDMSNFYTIMHSFHGSLFSFSSCFGMPVWSDAAGEEVSARLVRIEGAACSPVYRPEDGILSHL